MKSVGGISMCTREMVSVSGISMCTRNDISKWNFNVYFNHAEMESDQLSKPSRGFLHSGGGGG